jgi:hypothetical protein
VDDFAGRIIGAKCGQQAYALARSYWDGSVGINRTLLSVRRINAIGCELQYATLPGLYYKLQSTPDLTQPFTDAASGFTLATNSFEVCTNSFTGSAAFYRVISSLSH